MKILLTLLLGSLLLSNESWLTDFEKAKSQAAQSHKYILLNFSGSDWCGPCIRMHKDIFSSDVFENYAEKNLVLVNADFPRLRKNQLSEEQNKQNASLADKYNLSGKFPLTLILDANGKVLKTWEGCPNYAAPKFIEEVNSVVHANP